MAFGRIAARLGAQALKIAGKLTAANARALARRMATKLMTQMTKPTSLAKQGLRQAAKLPGYEPKTGMEALSQQKIGGKTMAELAREQQAGGGG